MPTPRGLVVKNGSKMRGKISCGMPSPLSLTSRTTLRVSVGPHLDADLVARDAVLGHRVRRVEQQVEHDLLEPRLVGPHRRRRLERRRDAGAVADLVPGDLDGRPRDRGEVDPPPRLAVGAGERPQLADDRRDPLGAAMGFVEQLDERLHARRIAGALGELARDPVEVEHHVAERVVDLVGDARGHRPDRGEPVGLDELRLEGLARASRRGPPSAPRACPRTRTVRCSPRAGSPSRRGGARGRSFGGAGRPPSSMNFVAGAQQLAPLPAAAGRSAGSCRAPRRSRTPTTFGERLVRRRRTGPRGRCRTARARSPSGGESRPPCGGGPCSASLRAVTSTTKANTAERPPIVAGLAVTSIVMRRPSLAHDVELVGLVAAFAARRAARNALADERHVLGRHVPQRVSPQDLLDRPADDLGGGLVDVDAARPGRLDERHRDADVARRVLPRGRHGPARPGRCSRAARWHGPPSESQVRRESGSRVKQRRGRCWPAAREARARGATQRPRSGGSSAAQLPRRVGWRELAAEHLDERACAATPRRPSRPCEESAPARR